MRTQFILLFIWALSLGAIQGSSKYTLDEIIWQDYNGSWVNSNKETYAYNTQGNKNQQVYFEWTNGTWTPLEKWAYAYDEQGHRVEALFQIFNASTQSWEDSTKTSFIYNDTGYLQASITSTKTRGSSNWNYEVKETNSVDEQGNIIQTTNYEWNEQANDWQGVVQESFTYSEESQLANYSSQVWDDIFNEWVPFDRETYTYQTNDITLSVYERWDEFSNAWENSFKDYTELYEEAGISKLRYLSEYWENGSWVYNSKEFHTLRNDDRLQDYTEYYYNTRLDRWDYYDKEEYVYSGNDLASYIDYNRDEPYNRWIEGSKESISFTATIAGTDLILPFEGTELDIYFNSRMDEIVLSDWNANQNSWVQSQKGIFVYSEFNPTGINKEIEHPKLSVFPNPATEKLSIHIPEDWASAHLALVNIAGQVVYNQDINKNQNEISVSQFKAGLYLLVVSDNNGNSFSNKLIIR